MHFAENLVSLKLRNVISNTRRGTGCAAMTGKLIYSMGTFHQPTEGKNHEQNNYKQQYIPLPAN